MSSQFKRPLSWLFSALGFRAEDALLPTQLETETVLAQLEVFQGGWFESAWEFQSSTVAESTVAGQDIVLASDPTVTRLITGVFISRVGGAGAAIVNVAFIEPNGAVVFMDREEALAVSGAKAWSDIGAGAPYWILPPGWQLVLDHPATAAAETLTTRVISLRVRAGFKPI